MTVEGVIADVLESWPLQLVVDTDTGRRHVALRLDTSITRGGRPADAGALQPGVWVRIEGDVSGPEAISASTVMIE